MDGYYMYRHVDVAAADRRVNEICGWIYHAPTKTVVRTTNRALEEGIEPLGGEDKVYLLHQGAMLTAWRRPDNGKVVISTSSKISCEASMWGFCRKTLAELLENVEPRIWDKMEAIPFGCYINMHLRHPELELIASPAEGLMQVVHTSTWRINYYKGGVFDEEDITGQVPIDLPVQAAMTREEFLQALVSRLSLFTSTHKYVNDRDKKAMKLRGTDSNLDRRLYVLKDNSASELLRHLPRAQTQLASETLRERSHNLRHFAHMFVIDAPTTPETTVAEVFKHVELDKTSHSLEDKYMHALMKLHGKVLYDFVEANKDMMVQ
jgi:hypothetical protein